MGRLWPAAAPSATRALKYHHLFANYLRIAAGGGFWTHSRRSCGGPCACGFTLPRRRTPTRALRHQRHATLTTAGMTGSGRTCACGSWSSSGGLGGSTTCRRRAPCRWARCRRRPGAAFSTLDCSCIVSSHISETAPVPSVARDRHASQQETPTRTLRQALASHNDPVTRRWTRARRRRGR